MSNETKQRALIVRSMDGAEVKRIPVNAPTARVLERTLMGVLRNMDTERFYVDDSEFDGLFPD